MGKDNRISDPFNADAFAAVELNRKARAILKEMRYNKTMATFMFLAYHILFVTLIITFFAATLGHGRR
jgi:hypothetical protein